MENLAILVDNKNDSTEAQDLLFSMGYKWRGLGEISKSYFYPRMNKYFIFMNKNEMDLQMAGYFMGSSRSYAESRFKEITLPELRDLVVLNRNNREDANVIDPEYDASLYLDSKGDLFVFHLPTQKWKESNLNGEEDVMARLKPIKKPMKEYLRKNSNDTYSYIGMVRPEHVSDFMIEIPEGADYYAKDSNNGFNGEFFFRLRSDGFDYEAVYLEGKWMNAEFSVDGQEVLWKRHTHPEELPFIDDEPKITTTKGSELDYIAKIHDMRDRYDGESDEDYRYQLEHYISRKEPSLNDQYAEIEKVRQDIINSPIHYADSTIECIDAMEAMMTPEQFIGYLRGNVFKYQWRYEKKNGIEDLKKAQWYLERLTEKVAEKNAPF